ncbi:hypothetical protein [Methanolapillus millepedarum]|uniref:hypothetical protein n=1 Tax=Methanolapillus millepedarum TaxID=3028296 RepID=UPI0030B8736C
MHLLFTVPIASAVYGSDCICCLQFQLHLLFTVPIASAVYSSNCTCGLRFRLHLLFTVPIASAVYGSDCICQCCIQSFRWNPRKSNAKRLIFREGLLDYFKRMVWTCLIFQKPPHVFEIQMKCAAITRAPPPAKKQ